MANIVVSSKTQTTIDVYIDNLDTSYSGNDRYIEWYANSVYFGTTYLAAYVASGGDYGFTGLDSFTEYIIEAAVYYSGGNVTLFLDSEYTRPDFFYWSTTKTSGNDFDIMAADWNALTSNINDVRVYRGFSTTSMTTVATDDELTAAIYNEVVNAIQGITGYGTYLSTVTQGSSVYASQFSDIESELNAIP